MDIIDLYLVYKKIDQEKVLDSDLYLVGISAIHIAAKYEEVTPIAIETIV